MRIFFKQVPAEGIILTLLLGSVRIKRLAAMDAVIQTILFIGFSNGLFSFHTFNVVNSYG